MTFMSKGVKQDYGFIFKGMKGWCKDTHRKEGLSGSLNETTTKALKHLYPHMHISNPPDLCSLYSFWFDQLQRSDPHGLYVLQEYGVSEHREGVYILQISGMGTGAALAGWTGHRVGCPGCYLEVTGGMSLSAQLCSPWKLTWAF